MKRREFMAAMLAIPVAPAAVPAMREVSNLELTPAYVGRLERWLLAPHLFGSVGGTVGRGQANDDDLVREGVLKAIALCREDISRASGWRANK